MNEDELEWRRRQEEEYIRQEAERRRRLEIENRRRELRREVAQLNDKRRQYTSMKLKLSSAVSQLSSAQQKASLAEFNYKSNYQGAESAKGVQSFNSVKSGIEGIIGKINGTIMSEANNQIQKIDREISEKNRMIESLWI